MDYGKLTELILITLDGAGSGVMLFYKWEETGGRRKNPRVRTGDHCTLSHIPQRGLNWGRSSDKRVAYHREHKRKYGKDDDADDNASKFRSASAKK